MSTLPQPAHLRSPGHTTERCGLMGLRAFTAVVLTAILLHGCSEKFGRLKAGETSVRFAKEKQSLLAGAPTLAGGVMVYAMRSDGYRAAFTLSDEGDTREFTLPNGSYRFGAVGWDSLNLLGSTRCGTASNAFELKGGSVTVPLNLTPGGCADAMFSPGGAPYLTGGVFRAPSFAFCSALSDVSVKAAGSDCSGGHESSRFFLGRSSPAGGVVAADFNLAASRLLYLADAHSPSRTELLSVPLSGKGTVMQTSPWPSGATGVKKFEIIPGTPNAIYLGDQEVAGGDMLYFTTMGIPGGKRIHTAAQVDDFQLSSTGRFVVYTAVDGTGIRQPFALDLAAPWPRAPNMLGHPSPTGGATGVPLIPGQRSIVLTPNYVGDPAQQRVLFVTDTLVPGHLQIYSNNLLGTDLQKLSNDGQAAQTFPFFAFGADGTKALWTTDGSTPNVFGLAMSSSTANTSSLLSAIGHNVIYFEASPYSTHLAYVNRTSGTNIAELYGVNYVSGAGFEKLLKTAAADDRTFRNVVFDPIGNGGFAFLYDGGGVGAYRLWGANAGTLSSGRSIGRSDHTTSLSSFPNPITTENFKFYAAGKVAYLADQTPAHPALTGVYSADLATTDGGISITPLAVGADAEIKTIEPGPLGLYFSQGLGLAAQSTAFLRDNGGTFTNLNTSPAIYGVDEIRSVPTPGTIPGFLNPVFLKGRHAANVYTKDIYFRTNSLSVGNIQKLTHMYWAPGGVGRFRVRLLGYRATGPGNVIPDSTGIESQCYDLTAAGYDGMARTTNLRIPSGDGSAASPFVVAIDVYGEDETPCTGPFTRTILPSGLAFQAGLAPDANRGAAVAADPTNGPRIFVRD